MLNALQFFLPEVLRGVHREWQNESLDGIYPSLFRLSGLREINLLGAALFISDQTLTPMNLSLQLAVDCDRVGWIDLRLGERIDERCRREPLENSKAAATMLNVVGRQHSIAWFYHVGFGERRCHAVAGTQSLL